MRGSNMKKTLEIILMFLAAVIICACEADKETGKFQIPKADIIYQAINDQLSDRESNNLLGLVNADGTGNIYIKLKYRPYEPVLSTEMGGIFFHVDATEPPDLGGGAGPVYFLSDLGTYKTCDSLSTARFIFPLRGTGYLLENDLRSIDLVDMNTCSVVKSLVEIPTEVPWVKFINSAYPSSSGKRVIFSENYREPSRDVIYIVDVQSGDMKEVLEGGYNATFSPDDQKIAYVGDNGIYVANVDGAGSKLIVRIDFSSYKNGLEPAPFWSPNGKTLLYHKCNIAECYSDDLSHFSIFKVDVNSGIEQKIVDGGLYPVWIK